MVCKCTACKVLPISSSFFTAFAPVSSKVILHHTTCFPSFHTSLFPLIKSTHGWPIHPFQHPLELPLLSEVIPACASQPGRARPLPSLCFTALCTCFYPSLYNTVMLASDFRMSPSVLSKVS